MALVWAIDSISKPYMPLSSFSFDSIVFNYGIATYLAQFHRFPIVSGMGMIWISPILRLEAPTMFLPLKTSARGNINPFTHMNDEDRISHCNIMTTSEANK